MTARPSILTAAQSLLTAAILTGVLLPTSARADDPAAVVKALEEELDALKETQGKNDLEIRKLRDRLDQQAKTMEAQASFIAELRKRIQEAEALNQRMQALEAQVAEIGGGGGPRSSKSPMEFGFHADVRVRPEISNNRTDFDGGPEDLDSFWGHRIRLGADLGVEDWVETRVTIQESRVFGETTSTAGGFWLHEGWAEVMPPWAPGLSFRAGRMELAYGRERLIGTDDFGLSGQAFDGVRVRYESAPWIAIDAFWAKTHAEAGFDSDGNFFGLYATTSAIPHSTLDLYYLGLMDETEITARADIGTNTRTEDRAIHTIGLRFEGLYFDGLFIEGEAVVQLGSRTNPLIPAEDLDHLATAYAAEISYQIPSVGLPTIGAFFSSASGDANPRDGTSVDFIPLFGSRHTLLGKMDLFNWSNILDVGGTLEFTPPRGFGFYSAFHYIRLVQSAGSLSGSFGNGKTPDPADPATERQALGNNVGMEIDAILSWSPSDLISLEGGYSVFIPKTAIESLGGGTDAAHWAYLQFRVQY